MNSMTPKPHRRVVRFQGAVRRLRNDPAEAARIDALVTAAELGQADAAAADTDLPHARHGVAAAIRDLLARRWGRRRGIGSLLILACGADYRRMSLSDRQRYITMSVLMLLATGQAFYCGTTVAQMSFSRPFLSVAGYGLFLAGSVFFIDRSIVGYIAPRVPGDTRSKKPRYPMRAIALRVALACVAAFLLAEVMLLQVFGARINVQVASDNLSSQQAAATQVYSVYQAEISPLQAEITQAQETVNARTATVQADLKQVDCEEFGCAGIPAGQGPAYQHALEILNSAQYQLAEAQASAQNITKVNEGQINALQRQREAAASNSAVIANSAHDVLAREQAFWILTVKYPEIAVARILLTLLLLSIDLAPVIVKITSRYGVYEEEIRTDILLARLRTEAYATTQEEKIRQEAEFELEYMNLQKEEKLRALRRTSQRAGMEAAQAGDSLQE